jgi:outer membrane protein OmpA-like peptidoglycan-associated protein
MQSRYRAVPHVAPAGATRGATPRGRYNLTMKRAAPTAIIVILGALTVVGGILAFRHLQTLQHTVDALSAGMNELQVALQDAEERAERSRLQADEAEERARRAAEQAESAEEEAAKLAENARQARAVAAAAARRASSEREGAAEARTEAERAEAERAAAQMRAEVAELRADRARHAAETARREAEELQRQRERDMSRLELALGQIAETRRTALGLVMNLGGSIEFEFDKAELRPENRELLSRVAGVLMTAEDFGIQVFGHTDDVGSPEYNQRLSERRARAVRDYLVEAGVDPGIISTQGFGKSAPLVEGSDEEARQRNRRVELAVIHVSGELPAGFLAAEPGRP